VWSKKKKKNKEEEAIYPFKPIHEKNVKIIYLRLDKKNPSTYICI